MIKEDDITCKTIVLHEVFVDYETKDREQMYSYSRVLFHKLNFTIRI